MSMTTNNSGNKYVPPKFNCNIILKEVKQFSHLLTLGFVY